MKLFYSEHSATMLSLLERCLTYFLQNKNYIFVRYRRNSIKKSIYLFICIKIKKRRNQKKKLKNIEYLISS